MALFKKHKTEPVPPEDTGAHDTSVGTAADVEAVMKKYDRESNTRVWEGMPETRHPLADGGFFPLLHHRHRVLSTMQEIRLPGVRGSDPAVWLLTFPARKGDTRVNHMPMV